MSGPIALVGSGEFLPAMQGVDRELLRGRPARAVIVPTAAAQEGAGVVDGWIDLGVEHYRGMDVEPVPLRVMNREDADDPANAAAVEGAGLVYLSGGNPGYLADTLRDTLLWEAIRAAHESGAALAGCSAGAAALTAIAHDVATEGFPLRPGLALVPHIAVLAHFDIVETWIKGVTARVLSDTPQGVTLVGIDEETAIVGDGERYAVHGRGRAYIVEPGGNTPFEPGSTLTIPRRDAQRVGG